MPYPNEHAARLTDPKEPHDGANTKINRLEKWERRLRLVSYLPETPVYGPEGRVITEEKKAAREEELILRDQLEKDGQALLRITREERLGFIARLRTHTSKWI